MHKRLRGFAQSDAAGGLWKAGFESGSNSKASMLPTLDQETCLVGP